MPSLLHHNDEAQTSFLPCLLRAKDQRRHSEGSTKAGQRENEQVK